MCRAREKRETERERNRDICKYTYVDVHMCACIHIVYFS